MTIFEVQPTHVSAASRAAVASPAIDRLSPAVLTALVSVQVLFGAAFPVSKIIIGVFPPLVWATMRMGVAAVAIAVIAIALRRPHPKPERGYFFNLAGLALLGVALAQGAFLAGLRFTTASNAAILNTLIPVFTLLVVVTRGQEAMNRRRAAGFLFAFLGVLVMQRVERLTLSDASAIGDLLVIASCVSSALYLSLSKRFMETHDATWTTFWLFVFGGAFLAIASLPQWRGFVWPEMTPTLVGCMAYAIVGATLITYFLNTWVLARARSSQVALFAYFQPIVGVAFAWAWLDEVPTPRALLAAGCIFAGMYFALTRAKPAK